MLHLSFTTVQGVFKSGLRVPIFFPRREGRKGKLGYALPCFSTVCRVLTYGFPMISLREKMVLFLEPLEKAQADATR